MDTETFIVYIKAYYLYKDIAEDVEAKCKLQITSWKGYCQNDKNRSFNGLMKDKLGGKTMNEFVGSSAKTYSYLINNSCEN